MTAKPLHLDIPALGPDPISLAGKDRWILGSDAQRADLVLPGLEVAGVHCVLTIEGGRLQVLDLGSEGGTQVDGAPITQTTLMEGQRLDVGPVSIWLSEGDAGDAARLPSIPGYELDREIGRGAGGHVYLALQTSLQRQVAIKVLAPALSHDQELVQRFESEARAAAALGHSNVVTVFDVGSKGAVHYLSMEYMAEGSLADRLEKRGPLSWRQTLRMIAETSKALAFAESRDLVHRDIKPANLMLTETGVTKLADLGLVMDLSQDHAGGPAMGTPHFLAPEVVRGQQPSAQSDLYSLGATAYQAATGHTPFQGANSKEILRAALTTEPQPPHLHDPEIPVAVSQLILNLMAKEPAQRPKNAQQVLESVDRLELELGLPGQRSTGGPLRLALMLAGPVILLVAFFVWNRTHPAPSEAGPQRKPSTGVTVQNPNGPGVSTPNFDFAVVPGSASGEAGDSDMGSEFEAQAQEQLKALQELDLPAAERIQRLRQFAQTFRGSNSADNALSLAGSIEERGRDVLRAERLATETLDNEKQILTDLARWNTDKDPLLERLEMLLKYETALTGEGLIGFESARQAALRGVLAQAQGHLEDELLSAATRLKEGDFPGVQSRLSEQIARFDPALVLDLTVLTQEGQAPAELLQLRQSLQELGTLLQQLPELEEQWLIATRAQDRLILGRSLGRSSGLRQELGQLDFSAARQRLADCKRKLRSESGRGWVTELDRDLLQMQAYLKAWSHSFDAGQWKSPSTLDPRSARPSNVGVTGVHSDWVSLDGTRVPLSEFLQRGRDFQSLLQDRVERALTPEESEGLSALYRLQAVLSVLDQVQEMLVQSSAARFTAGEVKKVREIMLDAQAGQTVRGLQSLAIEQQAAQALVGGLHAFSSKDYGAAAGYLERAFEVGRGSLLVLLLSDGQSLRLQESAPPATAVETQD